MDGLMQERLLIDWSYVILALTYQDVYEVMIQIGLRYVAIMWNILITSVTILHMYKSA